MGVVLYTLPYVSSIISNKMHSEKLFLGKTPIIELRRSQSTHFVSIFRLTINVLPVYRRTGSIWIFQNLYTSIENHGVPKFDGRLQAYGYGGNFLWLATAYELYGSLGLRLGRSTE